MSLYDGTQNVPEPYEVVEAMRTLIAADANVVNAQGIELAAHVFSHAPTDPLPQRYVIVREMEEAGGKLQTISGREIVKIQVEVSINQNEADSVANLIKFLNAVHQRVYQAVVNQKPAMTRNTLVLPFSRETTASKPEYDDQKHEWYSTALYFGVVQPI